MNDRQLSLAVGLPTLAALLGVLIHAMRFNSQFATLNARLTSRENRSASSEARLDARISNPAARISNFETKAEDRLEILIGKLIEVDSRFTRVEERLEHIR